jgi:hypothetical protein
MLLTTSHVSSSAPFLLLITVLTHLECQMILHAIFHVMQYCLSCNIACTIASCFHFQLCTSIEKSGNKSCMFFVTLCGCEIKRSCSVVARKVNCSEKDVSSEWCVLCDCVFLWRFHTVQRVGCVKCVCVNQDRAKTQDRTKTRNKAKILDRDKTTDKAKTRD